ncbi:O-methyltransferase [Rhodopseudomonas palustris]|uniref:Class I SAM-dependent methyltransferase n=1 Tax=Rhodopseudomonas palustris TaxID=1076 RepID=A0A418UY46_RHOPL|nr:class I SAM-dependent methyltransferase [Rhodopseudomonas palustris]RJF67318.1 class I SAM-dependent methyltransferase [Rhodopseudomonas palustris]
MKLKEKDARNLEEWYAGKELTSDWFTSKVPHWTTHLKGFTKRPIRFLELGSFEGRSAIFILNHFPQAHLTCIDLFNGEFENRFDSNLAEFGDRVTKLKGKAISHLDDLIAQKKRYQIIYLDAGKMRDPTLVMSIMAWAMLREGGVMIWDDYQWKLDRPADQRPHDAINAFLDYKAGEYDVLWKGSQVMIRRKPI